MSEPYSQSNPLRLAVMISGGGTTLENLIDRIADSRLRHVRIAAVISSRSDVRGVEITRQAGIEPKIIRPGDFDSTAAFSEAIADALDAAETDLVAMGGFLCLWRIPQRYVGRVLNVHPALLPEFGGRGMYGLNVHRAVLESGATESGCTVHLADDEYDHGPIVARRSVPVLPDDIPETLARRVGEAERELYPEVIQRVADDGLAILG